MNRVTSSDGRTIGAFSETTTKVTRALLACGVVAGPIYVVVGLVQMLVRDGFDIRRHALSLLANGDLGWIQVGRRKYMFRKHGVIRTDAIRRDTKVSFRDPGEHHGP